MNNIHGGTCSVKRILQTCIRRILVENSETMSSFATATVSFYSKPNKTRWHLYGRRGVTRGQLGAIPRVPNHYGQRLMTAGAPKSPNNVTSTFFNTVHLLPKDLKFEQGGAKRASCPGRCLTSLRPLYGRVSCTCDEVWVSSPYWKSLLRMWLSKLLQLSPRSAASMWWEKLLYTSKTISKTGPNSYGCFNLKHIKKIWCDSAFHSSGFSIE